MRTIGIMALFIAFILNLYFQKKASRFLKDAYRKKFFNKFAPYPNSLDDEAYIEKRGPKYRNIGLVIFISGLITCILLISLSS